MSGIVISGNLLSICDMMINYEVDKIVCCICVVVGIVCCLLVVVVVNYCGDGKIWKLLLEVEMVNFNVLVKDVVGFDVKCGDFVNVVNSQFLGMLLMVKDDLLLWKQLEMIQYVIQVVKYLVLVIGFLILVFVVICLVICLMGKKDEVVMFIFVGCEGEDLNVLIIIGVVVLVGLELEGLGVVGVDFEELLDVLL